MASLLWDPPWDRAVGVTDCQETLWLSVLGADPWGFPGAFPWTRGLLRHDQGAGGWEGKGGESAGAAAEWGSHPFKAWAALSRRRSKQKPPCALSWAKCRVREQKTPPLAEKEAKPDNADNKKSQKDVTLSEISAVTLSWAPMDRQTDTWVGQMELLVLASERAKGRIHHSVCYEQQYCTVPFINEMLPATVQH